MDKWKKKARKEKVPKVKKESAGILARLKKTKKRATIKRIGECYFSASEIRLLSAFLCLSFL